MKHLKKIDEMNEKIYTIDDIEKMEEHPMTSLLNGNIEIEIKNGSIVEVKVQDLLDYYLKNKI